MKKRIMAIGKTFIQLLGPNEQFPNNPGFPTIFLQKQGDPTKTVFGFNDGQGNTFSAFLVSQDGGGAGSTLNKIFDVSAATPSHGDVLVYDSATTRWISGSLPKYELITTVDFNEVNAFTAPKGPFVKSLDFGNRFPINFLVKLVQSFDVDAPALTSIISPFNVETFFTFETLTTEQTMVFGIQTSSVILDMNLVNNNYLLTFDGAPFTRGNTRGLIEVYGLFATFP